MDYFIIISSIGASISSIIALLILIAKAFALTNVNSLEWRLLPEYKQIFISIVHVFLLSLLTGIATISFFTGIYQWGVTSLETSVIIATIIVVFSVITFIILEKVRVFAINRQMFYLEYEGKTLYIHKVIEKDKIMISSIKPKRYGQLPLEGDDVVILLPKSTLLEKRLMSIQEEVNIKEVISSKFIFSKNNASKLEQ